MGYSPMGKPSNDPPTVDPDNVPETICIGKFDVLANGPLATLTFTHVRPKTQSLVDKGVIEFEAALADCPRTATSLSRNRA